MEGGTVIKLKTSFLGTDHTCERCSKKAQPVVMSYFNQDMLCLDCQWIERQHPLYQEAKRIENEEVSKGNRNFPGIGLPRGFKRFTELLSNKEKISY